MHHYKMSTVCRLPLALLGAMATIAATTVPASAQAQTSGDPLFKYQWHLLSYGQQVFGDTRPAFGMDLGVDDLHRYNIRGDGVVVSVVDTGVELTHPDLKTNVVSNGSWNFNNKTHDTTGSKNPHGTAVAGIIGAVGWNGIGGRGVAPSARLKSFNFLEAKDQEKALPYAWWSGPEAEDVQISNNSWGPRLPLFSDLTSVNEIADFERNMSATRGGLGAVYVKSSGNGFRLVGTPKGDSFCNTEIINSGVGCAQSIWAFESNLFNVMTVAAVNAAGRRSSYSTPGTSVWVSGFGGEQGFESQAMDDSVPGVVSLIALKLTSPEALDPAIVTTDLTGCNDGLNTNESSGIPDVSVNRLDSGRSSIDNTCNYTGIMNGTSAAAPAVSGVAALMLQVNPKLTYRDVKYILATTARQVDPGQSAVKLTNGTVLAPGWTINAAGHAFSNWYGFGLVDATVAVEQAGSFKSLPALIDSGWQQNVPENGVAIGGRDAPARLKIRINDSGISNIEAVQIQVKTDYVHGGSYSFRDDEAYGSAVRTPLQVTLTSPSGTRAYVLPAHAGYIGQNSGLVIPFAAVNNFLDESGDGDWTLEITDVDLAEGAKSEGNLTSFNIRVLGH